MGSSRGHPPSGTLVEVNKQILEIKKKIQLSEGQRKALFEDCEAERKTNSDEILKLKQEISKLVVLLQEHRSTSAHCRIKSARLENTIGHLGDKTCDETQEQLDLQVIEKSKKLDLMRYKTKQKESYLTKLAKEYQGLLSEKAKKYLAEKIEKPVKTSTIHIQNNILAVNVQYREAVHIYDRYKDIYKSLSTDAARFEYNIKLIEEELRVQNIDIERLQKITSEAFKMRGTARSALLQEEKAALNLASTRDRQTIEGKRLVEDVKQELEKLKKRIFLPTKTPVRAPEVEAGDEQQATLEIPPSQSPHPLQIYANAFDMLKEATGSTSTEEVLEHFCAQKATDARLHQLRNTSEEEKCRLENILENLTKEFERLQYAEGKSADENVMEVELKRKLIENQNENIQIYQQAIAKTQNVIQNVLASLQDLYMALNPQAIAESDPHVVLHHLEEKLQEMIVGVKPIQVVADNAEEETEENLEQEEDKWLPASYTSLLVMPVQQGSSPIPPATTASEDEEEVPTRGFLKRQAQMVVDAKSRRKNIRLQMRK